MRRILVLLVVVLGIAGSSVCGAELLLVEKAQSPYRIVVAENAPPPVRHAAAELQMFVEQMAGAKLPIVSDSEKAAATEVLIGESRHLSALGLAIDTRELGSEGYVIRASGKHLVIVGGAPRGTLYGVYGFLEDYLGCRWFAPGVSRIPHYDRITVGILDEKKIPVLEYREPFTCDAFDGDWCARNRMNSSTGRLEEKHGGKIRFADGYFVHTFNRLVPPEQYFGEHPEYFALVKGQRLKDWSQLCCTNEDVIRLCTEHVRAAIRAQPDAFVFSVSQNDCFNYCECEKCQALATAEDSQMAPVLQLVNKVAEAIEKEFPDKAIETLAYQWTRRPPKTMRPRPNVIVRLCSIECCFSHPLATCDSDANRAFREDIERWAKVSDRLWVWDYVTDFVNYLLPFPNQRVRNDNIRFFVANNVKGIFEQDTYDTLQSELASLGAYLTAKLLWNPDYDEKRAIDEFLEGYYGAAAPPIRRYIDKLHDHAEKENVHVNIWVPPSHPHLTDALLMEADRLWQEAEDLVKGSPEVLGRVRISRMSVDYAIVERARPLAAAPEAAANPLLLLARKRFEPFMKTLEESQVTRLREGRDLDKAAYRAELSKALGITP
ncbi:MAG: DUF4838 domain-containing protein [Planctomycetota bacterium]